MKRRVGKLLQETTGIKIYIQNRTMQFLNSSSNVKTVDAVQLSWNKKTINDNNCHTTNGDEIHSVQFYEGTGTVKVTCEPSRCNISSVMLNLKQPNIQHVTNMENRIMHIACF